MGTWPLIIVLVLTLIPTVILWVLLGRAYYDTGYSDATVRSSNPKPLATPSESRKWDFRAVSVGFLALLLGSPWVVAAIILVNSSAHGGDRILSWTRIPPVASIAFLIAFYGGGRYAHNHRLRPQALLQTSDV